MKMIYEREVEGTVNEIGEKLERAAASHQLGVIGVIDLKEKMAAKGVDFGPNCLIYEVCNPHRAKEVLEKNLSISTVLPCRIAVYEEAGRVKIATMLPTETLSLFDSPELIPVAEQIEKDIKGMIDEAVTV